MIEAIFVTGIAGDVARIELDATLAKGTVRLSLTAEESAPIQEAARALSEAIEAQLPAILAARRDALTA